ncbi:hypothetical protein PHLCEN_2v6797 [Hermanssonia centrifuga]|uniref:Uncharacterized protein n=1 Tax=Hermanssonia centrifuga TaxID=98765 RepID=A0A2R6NYD4_9APHY|nr:hypothetical protein PHLCEN_2v6797 [Hermanssonia centrifuga]
MSLLPSTDPSTYQTWLPMAMTASARSLGVGNAVQDLANVVGPASADEVLSLLQDLSAKQSPFSCPPSSSNLNPTHVQEDREYEFGYFGQEESQEREAPSQEAEPESTLYITVLSKALQHAQKSDPCDVETRVRSLMRRFGVCTEYCPRYFLWHHWHGSDGRGSNSS